MNINLSLDGSASYSRQNQRITIQAREMLKSHPNKYCTGITYKLPFIICFFLCGIVINSFYIFFQDPPRLYDDPDDSILDTQNSYAEIRHERDEIVLFHQSSQAEQDSGGSDT